MSKDILKLARKCGWPKEAPQLLPDTGSMNLEEFYWGAFLAGAKAMQLEAQCSIHEVLISMKSAPDCLDAVASINPKKVGR